MRQITLQIAQAIKERNGDGWDNTPAERLCVRIWFARDTGQYLAVYEGEDDSYIKGLADRALWWRHELPVVKASRSLIVRTREWLSRGKAR